MLKELIIRQFRNVLSAELVLLDGMNVVEGRNASGKTTILEAAYVLFRGRSFRTRNWRHLARKGDAGFALEGTVSSHSGLRHVRHKRTKSNHVLEIDGNPVQRQTDLLSTMPVMLVGPQVGLLISGKPEMRRRWLDFALFHVKHQVRPVWGRYSRSLSQRNVALRTGRSDAEIQAIEVELARSGTYLSEQRRELLREISASYPRHLSESLGVDHPQLSLRCGWNEGQSYSDALNQGRRKDRELGYTHLGPHRADVVIRTDGGLASNTVSRGQEKMLAISLLFGEASYLKECSSISPLILLDDVAAEMDQEAQQALRDWIVKSGIQSLITSLPMERNPWFEAASKVFHVEQGVCSTVL